MSSSQLPLHFYCYEEEKHEENTNQYDFIKDHTMMENDNKKTKKDQLRVRLFREIKNRPKVKAFITQMRQEKGMEGSS